MKKAMILILILSVLFVGCARQEDNPADACQPSSEHDSHATVETSAGDVNNQDVNNQDESKQVEENQRPDVVFVPTPQDVVDKMLELANVQQDDLVYDLGCGDGRIVVTAAKRYGCKAVGYDIDPERVKESLENVDMNNVGDLVRIEQKDIFTLDLSEATVIALYLLPDLNVKLIPQLKELKPGSRIVSHDFGMRGVKPDKLISLFSEEDKEPHEIYLWTSPLKMSEEAAEQDPSLATTWER